MGRVACACNRAKCRRRGVGRSHAGVRVRLRRREPHRGRNPRTGNRVDVPSKRVAYFKPGKELKELTNREPAQAVPPPPPTE